MCLAGAGVSTPTMGGAEDGKGALARGACDRRGFNIPPTACLGSRVSGPRRSVQAGALAPAARPRVAMPLPNEWAGDLSYNTWLRTRHPVSPPVVSRLRGYILGSVWSSLVRAALLHIPLALRITKKEISVLEGVDE